MKDEYSHLIKKPEFIFSVQGKEREERIKKILNRRIKVVAELIQDEVPGSLECNTGEVAGVSPNGTCLGEQQNAATSSSTDKVSQSFNSTGDMDKIKEGLLKYLSAEHVGKILTNMQQVFEKNGVKRGFDSDHPKSRIVLSLTRSKQPHHFVEPGKVKGVYSCQCPGYKSSKLRVCSHTLAVVLVNKEVDEFLQWLSRKKNGKAREANLTNLMENGANKNAGKKRQVQMYAVVQLRTVEGH